MQQSRVIDRAFRVPAALALVVAFGGLTGCAAKVRQDVFDQTIAEMRGDMDALDGRVAQNESQLSEHEAMLASLRSDLEALSSEFGDMRAQIQELENGLRFAMPIHFEFDDAAIRDEDRPALDRFASVASKYYPSAIITVEGFADPFGPTAYNKRLSEERAESVAMYLAGPGGLERAALRTVGYGEDRQVIPGAQGPGLEGMENRRVTFVIEMVDAPRQATVAAAGEGL